MKEKERKKEREKERERERERERESTGGGEARHGTQPLLHQTQEPVLCTCKETHIRTHM